MRSFTKVLFGVALSVVSIPALAQEDESPSIKYEGSHPPDPKAVAVAMKYVDIGRGSLSLEERSDRRAGLISPGYFYHGLDGHPISFDEFLAREMENGEKYVRPDEKFDVVFHQFKNTALISYKSWSSRGDGENERAALGSGLIVLSRSEDGWQVVSDFLGAAPSAHYVPARVRRMQQAQEADLRRREARRAAERRLLEEREAALRELGGIPTCPGDPRCPAPKGNKN